jgi:hypothetical protein
MLTERDRWAYVGGIWSLPLSDTHKTVEAKVDPAIRKTLFRTFGNRSAGYFESPIERFGLASWIHTLDQLHDEVGQ